MLSTSYTNAVRRTDASTALESLRWSQPYTQRGPITGQHSSQPVIHTLDQHRPADTDPLWSAHARTLKELQISYDPQKRIFWQFMNPRERPSFTPALMEEMRRTFDLIEDMSGDASGDREPAISYLVLGSRIPGIFNLGGHLPLFMRLIEDGDREGLRQYAHLCIYGQYRWAVNLDRPLCTIAVVQGDALGGGFEAALAHDLIIAERSAKFGLPEVLFNMFPGMGAYSFLSRKLDSGRAERMILSGKVYSAEELHDMGVVDRLVDDGRGVEAVHDLIKEQERAARTWRAVFRARQIVNPITHRELLDVTDLWVDMAMSLDPRDLRKMKRLATAQDRRWSKIKNAA